MRESEMPKPSDFKYHARFEGPALCVIGGEGDPVDISGKPFYVDGYQIGDRLLEGVVFKCLLDEDGRGVSVEVQEEHRSYFSGLNMRHWLESVAQSVPEMDIVSSTPKNDRIESDVELAKREDYPQFFGAGERAKPRI